jgi:hypothetical protein
MEQIDSFIEYLFVVEENSTPLTKEQVDKLQIIQSKVSEIVDKIKSATPTSQPVQVQVKELQLAENKVQRFSEFQELNEKIRHRGNKWEVTTKDGKKVLGTHSSRKEAVKQLQAIEISKTSHH